MNLIFNKPLPPVTDEYENVPIERIFDNGVVGVLGRGGSAEPGTYENYIKELIDDACDFEDSTLSPAREENLEYFYGEEPASDDEGTSSVVSTDFRDTVMAILPSLIRIFTSTENVLNCLPNYEGQEDAARQCTDYLNYVFWHDNEGFLIIHDIIKDALRCKTGATEWWTETSDEITQDTYRNITQEQLQYLIYENETVEVIDLQRSEVNPDFIEEVTVRFQKSKPIIRVESVALDELRIDRRAKSVKTANLIGRDQVTNVGEVVKMGFDLEDLQDYLGAQQVFNMDRQYRNSGIDISNPLEDFDIRFGRYFIRFDKDGDGIPELREIMTVGDNHVIIYDEVVTRAQIAIWTPDPEPHTIVGDSPADLVKDIQRIKTNMLRGALDSLAASIWSRTIFNETLVNAEDVLNEEIGAAIRTKGNPNDTVASVTHNFVGQPVFAMFDVMERLRQQRTGISDASKGLDPRALQSTALQGVDAIVSGAQERIELCARILAETGMKDMFEGLLAECVNSPNQKRTIQLRGKWVDINPSTFDPTMKIQVNPTLGKGSDMTRMMALQEVKATQTMVMEKFGVENPLCGAEEFRNTIVDMLEISNIKNAGRYFKVLTPEVIQAIAEAPKEPDPATLLAQAEMEKTRAKVAESMAKQNFDDYKLRVDDDFRRDQMMIKGLLEAAKIEGEWAYDVNEQELAALNTANEVITGQQQAAREEQEANEPASQ